MKKKFVLPIVLLSVIGLVLLNIFTAGDKHVEVVGENVSLNNQVTTLKSENSNLKSLNADLTKKNQELTAENSSLNSSLNDLTSKKKEEKTKDIIPELVFRIEIDVQDNLGWISPDDVYEELTTKIGRKPTKEEYKQVLLDLLNKDLLYFSGYPDPYNKGEKVSKSKIDKLVNRN